MHIMHTLYHTKTQYANIRPRGRDEKQPRLTFFLTFHTNIRDFFIFFKYFIYQSGAQNLMLYLTNDERKDFLAFNICAYQTYTPHQDTSIMPHAPARRHRYVFTFILFPCIWNTFIIIQPRTIIIHACKTHPARRC